jgi:SAM-dependent methyltransferase
MSVTTDYSEIVTHYEACLARHGDSHRGVDWPYEADAQTRYRVMLEVIRETPISPPPQRPITLLDFGCGAGHLLEYLRADNRSDIQYLGLDISPRFVELCQTKFPGSEFLCGDILQGDVETPEVDYVVMNGVFTEKRSLPFDEMWDYCRAVLGEVFPRVRRGLAFNVMSKHVDWEREDLFHLPFDLLASFLRTEISRHYQFRADYGLYEYTAYVYR